MIALLTLSASPVGVKLLGQDQLETSGFEAAFFCQSDPVKELNCESFGILKR